MAAGRDRKDSANLSGYPHLWADAPRTLAAVRGILIPWISREGFG